MLSVSKHREPNHDDSKESTRLRPTSVPIPIVAEGSLSSNKIDDTFVQYCNDLSRHDLNDYIALETFRLPNFVDSRQKESSSSTDLSESNSTKFTKMTKNLLSKTHEHNNYSRQTLVIVVTKDDSCIPKDKDLLISSVEDIESLLFIERSSGTQAYTVKNLHRCPHFSLLTTNLPQFQHKLNMLLKGPIPMLLIPSSVNYKRDGCVVQNSSSCNQNKSELLKNIHNCFVDLFKNGLGEKFTLHDSGRGDVVKESDLETDSSISSKELHRDRRIPTITLGYSTQDCSQYRCNRMSLGGNMRPTLRDGDLSKEALKSIYQIVEQVLDSDVGKDAFDVDGIKDDLYKKFRRELHKDFTELLTGNRDDYSLRFRTEGVAIIIAEKLGAHLDKGNSALKKLNDAVAITTNLPLSVLDRSNQSPSVGSIVKEKKFIKNLQEHLTSRGYSESFPCTIVLYSRKCVDNLIKNNFNSRNLVRKMSCLIYSYGP